MADMDPEVAKLEHLKAYVDNVLEAFQVGSGVMNNATEPITIDIARRLIWGELQRVLLQDDVAAQWCAWLRLSATDETGGAKCDLAGAPRIIKALHAVDYLCDSVSFRLYGPRKPGDPTVAYACLDLKDVGGDSSPAVGVLTKVLNLFEADGIEVRDITFGQGA